MRYRQTTEDRTIYYINGSYEVEVTTDKTLSEATTRASIGDYALLERKPGEPPKLLFLHTDRLGSVDTITLGDVSSLNTVAVTMIVEQRSYNVFGRIVSNLWILGTDFTYEVEALADVLWALRQAFIR